MTLYDRRSIGLAISLSALAGYVDALGFMSLGNFFVSFMSGNSTRLGIALGQGNFRFVAIVCGVVSLFVAGVVVGTLVGHRARNRKSAVLTLVALLIALAALFHGVDLPRFGLAAMLLAMGAENAVFQREGEVSIGLTYMTGALVKLGQRIAAIFHGGPKFAWVPYALLWLGLVSGAAIGAGMHQFGMPLGLGLAAGAALVLGRASTLLGSRAPAVGP
ncbi:MAG: YoaK family protein [Fimbriimonas sp.]